MARKDSKALTQDHPDLPFVGAISRYLEEAAPAPVRKAVLAAKEPKKAEAVLADVQAAAEKAVSVGKENVDRSLVAQRRVADLVTKRVQANIDEFKALAA